MLSPVDLTLDVFRTTEDAPLSVPVFISPDALAACVYLDYAYIPELTNPLSLNIAFDDLCISAWNVCFSLS